MAQKTAKEIRNLNAREDKAWRVIDQCLGNKKGIPAKVRLAAAEFVLKRLYPEKHIFGGEGPNGEFKVVVEVADEDNASPEPRNRIQEYFEV